MLSRAATSRAAARSMRSPTTNVFSASAVRRFLGSTAPASSFQHIYPDYDVLQERLDRAKHALDRPRPLTLAEKFLFAHLADPTTAASHVRGKTSLLLQPDRVAMQDASAQTAILQFMQANLPSPNVPVSVHCDHLVVADTAAAAAAKSNASSARNVSAANLAASWSESAEIYDFLRSASRRFGFDFWAPGNGIIHQLVLENYATPGMLLLGTDSHTPNAGGLGAMAIGVGGADAVDAMCGIPWELAMPRVTGIKLTGKLRPWTSPKDIVLSIVGQLTVRGGTGHVLEYFGEGLESLSCTGLATIANMGAEMGATTSLFPYTGSMRSYLQQTGRSDIVPTLDQLQQPYLAADERVYHDPAAHYDRVIEIDLSTLEPHLNGPFSPDRAIPISQLKARAEAEGWPTAVSAGLIGSCTNSSYEDMGKAAHVLTSAQQAGLKLQTGEFLVTPGSDMIRATIERDGLTDTFAAAGATVLANACGPCIGQWKRHHPKEPNVILTSFNRNFVGRNDGNAKTLNFLASPEMVTALSIAGTIAFNPLTDTLPVTDANGTTQQVPLTPPPADLPHLPAQGFAAPTEHVEQNAPHGDETIAINPASQRLEPLPTWPAWDGAELQCVVLTRVRGKCTTDHISAAGPWLKYKGHLTNISRNTLMTAVDDETGEVGTTRNVLSHLRDTIPNTAFAYHARGIEWCVVGDHNYGEGSAREHAALQVRFLGGRLVVARSFARIHETNLKKQGVVPLTLANPERDYAAFVPGASVRTRGLVELLAEDTQDPAAVQVDLEVLSPNGSITVVPTVHSLTKNQLTWIRAGGALNAIAAASS
ncbi:aconitate hydratase [Allomyces javanicus]|nr:aconitate hydratase [Allomyces javanicus]